MNARLYDPVLGRFISADTVVAYSQSTQGFNRYSYTDNNSLSRVDFSGHNWLSDIWKSNIRRAVYFNVATDWNHGGKELTAITVGAYLGPVNPVLAGFASNYISSGGNLRAAAMGAFSAGLFYGVGTLSQSYSWGPITKAAAHGVAGGIMSEVTGGEFRHGFLAGAFTKGFSGPTERLFENSVLGRAFVAAVVGGTASRLGGGKFSNGAMMGAFSRLFNDEHPSHRKKSEIENVDNEELVKMLGEIYEQGTYKTGVLGKIFVAADYLDFDVREFSLTVRWAIRDVEYYREIQMHNPYPQGSLIRFENVDWSIYDKGGSARSVVNNLFHDALRKD